MPPCLSFTYNQQGEQALSLEKGPRKGDLPHISACLMELYFFACEHINIELSRSTFPPLVLLPFLA